MRKIFVQGWLRRLMAFCFLLISVCCSSIGQTTVPGSSDRTGNTEAENTQAGDMQAGDTQTRDTQARNEHPGGSIAGIVVDQQGAAIPNASIVIERLGGTVTTVAADEQGRFSAADLVLGTYVVKAQSPGFRVGQKNDVSVGVGSQARLTLILKIDVQDQQVVVSDSEADTSPDKNGDAIVIKGDALQALSNDQTEMQTQLQAIAGADPGSAPQLYVDGFSGGKMPPKSSIREIRINSNPYSAQYDDLGSGRIEIFTKPGTDKLHGDYWMEGNDSTFNALNPFVTSQPPYYSYQFEGDVNGPISKIASYFASIYDQKSNADSVVNAAVLDASLNQVQFTQAISTPVSNLNFSPRFDFQLGKNKRSACVMNCKKPSKAMAELGNFL